MAKRHSDDSAEEKTSNRVAKKVTDQCWQTKPNQDSNQDPTFVLKDYPAISQEIFWMFKLNRVPLYNPTDVSKIKTLLDVIWIDVCIHTAMMNPVLCRPFEARLFKRSRSKNEVENFEPSGAFI